MMAKLGSLGAGITTELHWAAYAAAQVQIPKPNSFSAFCFNCWAKEMYSISFCFVRELGRKTTTNPFIFQLTSGRYEFLQVDILLAQKVDQTDADWFHLIPRPLPGPGAIRIISCGYYTPSKRLGYSEHSYVRV
jgi:hypothetical protein